LIADLLWKLHPSPELLEARTIVIDDRLGREMAASAEELLESCVRLRVPKMAFGDTLVALDDEACLRLESCSQVSLANAVSMVEHDDSEATVFFKRYLPPRRLSVPESSVLSFLRGGPAKMPQVTRACMCTVGSVRELEEARIVNILLPADVCHDLLQKGASLK
jgi:hypothetical protein